MTRYHVADGQVCCISSVQCDDCENRTVCKPLPKPIEELLLTLEDKRWMEVAQ